MRVLRSVVLAGCVALVVGVAPAAGSSGGVDGEDVELPATYLVGEVEVPVLASFTVASYGGDKGSTLDRYDVRGFVHGVQRVDGGTVLYYSLGATGGTGNGFRGTAAFGMNAGSENYRVNAVVDVWLLDVQSGHRYGVLPETDLAVTAVNERDLDAPWGELTVGWAVFPELPEDTTSVVVQMGHGTVVGSVPVGDGALAPVVEDVAPVLGGGWPPVSQGAELTGSDPEAVTWDLVVRTEDVAGEARTDETVDEVAVSLSADVLFDKDFWELSGQAQEVLARVGADIAGRGTGEVVVTGHTDSDGTADYNQGLSERRAESVRAVLEPLSGGRVSFRVEGRGEDEPIADNSTPEGQALNRRVTVVYQIEEGS